MGRDGSVRVDFHRSQLIGFEDERGIFVALKPIVAAIGLTWAAQVQRLKRDAVLQVGRALMILLTDGGPQECTCLRLDLLHRWLFTIDDARLKPEVRETVRVFQQDCYAALAGAFEGSPTLLPSSVAVDPRQQ